MNRLRPAAALAGALVALAAAAAVNVGLAAIAGDAVQIPGELGYAQVVAFTVVMAVPAAIVLWLLPRAFPWIAMAVAVLTVPVPIMEFGARVGAWLAVMHVATGIVAAVVAPRVARTVATKR